MKSEERKRADLFKALADENRLRILRMLQEGERCACALLDELQIGPETRQVDLLLHFRRKSGEIQGNGRIDADRDSNRSY